MRELLPVLSCITYCAKCYVVFLRFESTMKINRSFEYRIYPTKEQQVLILKTFGCCRFIYNQMLYDKIEHYRLTKTTLNNTPAQYKEKFVWLKEVDSTSLAKVKIDLMWAFKRFFNNPNVGFPKFKSKKRERKSYTSTRNNSNNIRFIDSKHLQLPKLGSVKIKLSRNLPYGSSIKNVTVKQDSDNKYFAVICVQYDVCNIENSPIRKAIGLDYSSPLLYVDSENRSPNIEHWTRMLGEKLSKEQRKLSRCVYGSKNYLKQATRVNKVYAKIKRCRKDQLNKLSTDIADNYDLVAIEDLNMVSMSKMLKLGKSTMDNSFGMFISMLDYKLKDRGKYLIKVDKFFASTKTCSICGEKNKNIALSTRQWVCQSCGSIHNRDYNAAKNILSEGIRIWKGRAYPDSLFMLEQQCSSSRKD